MSRKPIKRDIVKQDSKAPENNIFASAMLRVFYFNDRKKSAHVQFRTLPDAWKYAELQPAQGKYFEIYCPPGFVPYVKVWETGGVLIDCIAKNIPDLEVV